jgi:hypothetical protein
MSRHYTAIIRIVGVDHPEPVQPLPGRYPLANEGKKSDGQKASTEIASFTIRSDSIAELITKAQKHLELVEDSDG